jgi:PAS domain S-box-containing protein
MSARASEQVLSSNRPAPRVLIVDDNADLVSALCAVLGLGVPASTAGGSAESLPRTFSITTASSGRDAREVAAQRGFDVAIVDVKLPDTSGVDLLVQLRELCPWSEIVLITGFATLDTALQALASGAFAFVLKSFRPEELLSTVEQAVTKVELKRERAELERRYRELVDVADVLVVMLDRAGIVTLFNRRAGQLGGVSVEQARGTSFVASWVAPNERAKVAAELDALRSDGQAREVEANFGALDAVAPRRVRWHFSYAGESIYGLGIDVTERIALERRARENQALSAMGALAMHLAHEIRNPLNAAVLQLNMLGRQVDKLGLQPRDADALKQRARIVGDEVARLNRMLTEFLELARPRDIARQTFALDELVGQVLELQAEAFLRHNIQLRTTLAPLSISGDAEKWKQVVLNLVVNAIEAMRDGGQLSAHLRAVRDGEREVAELELSDTGPGIDAAVLTQVFDPFFTTKEAGTGLGLSIVRKIVEQHGGTVTLRTARGEGTAVVLRSPLADVTAA